jgi:hypothetical protein
MSERRYMWSCNRDSCTTRKGPYYNIGELRAAIAEHLNMQHVNDAPAMDQPAAGNGRMRSASKANPNYDPPTW